MHCVYQALPPSPLEGPGNKATPEQQEKFLNFKQSIKDLDFEIGTTNFSCNCHVSDFKYEPAGHIVTGNLGIVENRKVISKGPSYSNINWDTDLKIIKKAVRAYKISGLRRKE